MKRLVLIAAGCFLGGLVVAGVGLTALRSFGSPARVAATPAPMYSFRGSLTAVTSCSGLDGAPVNIRDDAGKVIGAGSASMLDQADATTVLRTAYDGVLASMPNGAGVCVVGFDVRVPQATFYQVQLGTHSGPTYSFADLQAKGFNVAMTLNAAP